MLHGYGADDTIPSEAKKNDHRKGDQDGLESIFQLIEKGSHAQARYSYLENIFMHRSPGFATYAKKEDNPFDCTAAVMDISSYCPLFVFGVRPQKRSVQNANVHMVSTQKRVNIMWALRLIQVFHAPKRKSSVPKVTMERLHFPSQHKFWELTSSCWC